MPDGNAYLLVAPPGYADGGLLGSLLARAGIGGPPETMTEKFAKRDAARAGQAKPAVAAPAPAQPTQPQTQLGGVNMNAMQRREAAAGLADGGPVMPEEEEPNEQPIVPENGMIEGPGGPTDDAIAAEMPTGSYVVPADVTQALVSDGESTLSPEVLAAASAAYFDVIKAALHTPAEQQPKSPAVPAFRDGGTVDDTLKRNSFGDAAAAANSPSVQQIPTAGAPAAPRPDGSQNNPFNSEVGRNVTNTLAALPGASSLAGAAGRMATAGASEVSGPLARATQLAPVARGAIGGTAFATGAATSSPAQAAMSSTPPIPGGTQPQDSYGSQMSKVGDFLGTAAKTLVSAPGYGLNAPATSSAPRIPGGTQQPYSDARNGTGGYAALSTPRNPEDPNGPKANLTGPVDSAPANPNNVTRVGNSYSGGPNITESGLTINGMKYGDSGVKPVISAQNMQAADNLSASERMASVNRVTGGRIPGGTDATQLGSQVGFANSGDTPQVYNLSAADRLTQGGFGAMRGTPELYRAKYGEQAFRAGMGQENKNMQAEAKDATDRFVATGQESGANSRAALQERGATQRALIGAEGTIGAARLRAAGAAGKAPEGYQWSADGKSMQAIPGGPADLKNSKEGVQAAKDAQGIFDTISMAEKSLQGATGSYLGAARDKAGQAIGYATDGAKATAELKVLEGNLMAKMPKFSGPTSDRDAKLYQQMAGDVADPTKPVEVRRAALQTLKQMQESNLPSPDADAYGKMPVGSYYRTPNGEVRRKG